jgi:hypothetical protein
MSKLKGLYKQCLKIGIIYVPIVGTGQERVQKHHLE